MRQCDAEKGERLGGPRGVVAGGGGDVRGPARAQEPDGRGAEGGHHLGDGAGAHLGAVFIEGHIGGFAR